MLVKMLNLLVEHGVQQIRYLDHYIDNLTCWLCGQRLEGALTIDWQIECAAFF